MHLHFHREALLVGFGAQGRWHHIIKAGPQAVHGIHIDDGIEGIAEPSDVAAGLHAEPLVYQVPQGEEVVPIHQFHITLHTEVTRRGHRHDDVAVAAPPHNIAHGGIEDQFETRHRGHRHFHVQPDAAEVHLLLLLIARSIVGGEAYKGDPAHLPTGPQRKMDVGAFSRGRIHVDIEVVREAAHSKLARGVGLAVVELVVACIGIEHLQVGHFHAHVEVPILQAVVDDGSVGDAVMPLIVVQFHLVQREHVRTDLHPVGEAVEGVQVVDPQAGVLQFGIAVDLWIGEAPGDIDNAGDLALDIVDGAWQVRVYEA